MSRRILAGTTDVSVVIRIIDSTDGTPETGVVFNTSGIDLEYRRELAASVDITEATLAALTTAHADGGFLHIGNGYYRLDLPDAACAAGATGVLVHGTVTGMVVIGEYIELVAYNPYDGVRLGLTALPNAAADAAGGLPISDAGGLALDTQLAATNEITAARMGALTDWINGGRLDLILDIIAADTTTDIPALIDALPTAAENADAIWDEDATGHQTGGTFGQAIGDPVADTNTIFKAVVTDAAGATVGVDVVAVKADTAATLVDTNELQTDWVNGGRLDLILDIIAADTTTDIPALIDALPTAAENADAIWDEDATAHQTQGTFGQAIGDPVADADTIWGLANTNLDAAMSSRASAAALSTAQTDISAILVDTGTTLDGRIPTALVGGRMDSSVGAVAAGAITAAAIADGAIDRATLAADTGLQSIRSNTAQAGAAGTITLDARALAVDDFYNDTLIYLTGGTGAGQVRRIRDYVGATRVATIIPVWTTNPDVTTTFAILPLASVWDETLADHLDAGSTGNALNAAGAAGDPWSTALPGAYGAGTAGKIVGDNINAPIATVDTVVDTINANIGTPSNLGSGATVAANLVDIEAQTDDIGAAGAGLTALPWNAAWDAEVQSEVDDALVAQRLDELVNADSDIDGAAPPTVGSVVHELMTKTAGSFTYDQSTDSLEAIRDKETDIETDTNELQADWVNGGRLDLILDIIAADVVNLDGAAMRGTDSAALASVCTEARLAELAAANLPADTDTLLSRLSAARALLLDEITAARMGALTDWINGGRLDLILDIIAADTTTDIPALIAALNNLSAAQVNAEVVDALNVDTYAEIGQEAPAATQTLRKMVAYLYKSWRNRKTQTATTRSLYNDAGAVVDQVATDSDDGTTFVKGELGTGP